MLREFWIAFYELTCARKCNAKVALLFATFGSTCAEAFLMAQEKLNTIIESLASREFWIAFCELIGARKCSAKVALLFAAFGSICAESFLMAQERLNTIIESLASREFWIAFYELIGARKCKEKVALLFATFGSTYVEAFLMAQEKLNTIIESLASREFWIAFCELACARKCKAKVALLFATFGSTCAEAFLMAQKKLNTIIGSITSREFWLDFYELIGARKCNAKVALLFATFGSTCAEASLIAQKKLNAIIENLSS
jgi:predicted RNase H-like HicB family nuclease